MVAAVLTAAVILGLKQSAVPVPAVPTSAVPEKGVVYALSYEGLDTEKGLSLLLGDLEYMRRLGLRFILPGEEAAGGAIVILQGTFDVETLAGLLRKNGARAVLTAETDMPEAQAALMLRYADEGLFALAAPAALGCSPAELFAVIGNAGAEFALRFRRRCTVFVSTVPDETDESCFLPGSRKADRITLFIFGNGRNEGPFPRSGLTVLNRCMRIPEWTIMQFFSEIAVKN